MLSVYGLVLDLF